MTTSDLERQLVAVLHSHAEDAMSRTNTEEKLEDLAEVVEGATGVRRRGLAVAALVAAAAALAAVAWATWSASQPETAPAGSPEGIATTFVAALAANDAVAAEALFSDDVDLSPWTGLSDRTDSLEAWRSELRFIEEAGASAVLPGSCEEFGPARPSGTVVRCAFDYHALGSEELGKGPFSDNYYTLRVLDGEIVTADVHNAFATNGFAEQVWEPFAAWIRQHHTPDGPAMYGEWPGQSTFRPTERSAELWRQHIAEYVATR